MAVPSHKEVLEKAVAALLADAGVAAIVGTRVYSYLPQDEINPTIRVRWDAASEWDTKDSQGFDGSLTVDFWTGDPTNRDDGPALEAADAINAALHLQEFTLTGAQNLLVRFSSQTVVTEPDGATVHLIMRFRLITTN